MRGTAKEAIYKSFDVIITHISYTGIRNNAKLTTISVICMHDAVFQILIKFIIAHAKLINIIIIHTCIHINIIIVDQEKFIVNAVTWDKSLARFYFVKV